MIIQFIVSSVKYIKVVTNTHHNLPEPKEASSNCLSDHQPKTQRYIYHPIGQRKATNPHVRKVGTSIFAQKITICQLIFAALMFIERNWYWERRCCLKWRQLIQSLTLLKTYRITPRHGLGLGNTGSTLNGYPYYTFIIDTVRNDRDRIKTTKLQVLTLTRLFSWLLMMCTSFKKVTFNIFIGPWRAKNGLLS